MKIIIVGLFTLLFLSCSQNFFEKEGIEVVAGLDFKPSLRSTKIVFSLETDTIKCRFSDSLKFNVVFRNISQDTVCILPESYMKFVPCDSVGYFLTDYLEWSYSLLLTPTNNLARMVLLAPDESYIYQVKTLDYLKVFNSPLNLCVRVLYANRIKSYKGTVFEIGEFNSEEVSLIIL